jgi:hypothetical protein
MLALGDGSHRAGNWLGVLSADFAIRVLEAPRRADPRRFGTPTEPGDWYVATGSGPDPHAFVLSLSALEETLLEGSDDRLPIVGIGQGAALALSLACCWPERLAAVVACKGDLPVFPPGGIAERPMVGLPILCVACDSMIALEHRGGRVAEHEVWDDERVHRWLIDATRLGARGILGAPSTEELM